MDPFPTRPSLRYRIEHRPPARVGNVLDVVEGLRAAAWAFEDEFRRLTRAGDRGMLALVCELPGCDAPVAERRLVLGAAA